jgi:hypothetical protein
MGIHKMRNEKEEKCEKDDAAWELSSDTGAPFFTFPVSR